MLMVHPPFQPRKEIDLSWVGTKVKQALKGRCPFCSAEIDFCDMDEGKPHRCPDLPSSLDWVEVKEFTETEVLLVGPVYLVGPVAERILSRYPEVRVSIVVPEQRA